MDRVRRVAVLFMALVRMGYDGDDDDINCNYCYFGQKIAGSVRWETESNWWV